MKTIIIALFKVAYYTSVKMIWFRKTKITLSLELGELTHEQLDNFRGYLAHIAVDHYIETNIPKAIGIDEKSMQEINKALRMLNKYIRTKRFRLPLLKG